VAAIATPLAAVLALRIGTRVVVATGLVLMAGGLVVAAFNSHENTAYWGPIIVAMVLLALGLSAITAPTTEAVMGSVPDEQRGAAAGVNNTTRELGGTLGVAVFGSIFASSYAPRITDAFRSLPIPAGPKAEAHQSMAAALVVVQHAPKAARPFLENIAFNAFHSGLFVACVAGAVVAFVGGLAAFVLLPGRSSVPVADVPAAEAGVADGTVAALVDGAGVTHATSDGAASASRQPGCGDAPCGADPSFAPA